IACDVIVKELEIQSRFCKVVYKCLLSLYRENLIGSCDTYTLPLYSYDLFVKLILKKVDINQFLTKHNCQCVRDVIKKYENYRTKLDDWRLIPTGPSDPDDPHCASFEVILARQRHQAEV